MINTKRASLLRIIFVDYLAFYSSVMLLLIWIFYAYDLVRGEQATRDFMTTLLAITAVLSGVLVWRILAITLIFKDGQESVATINRVSFYRGRCSVVYIHEYLGKKYLCRSWVMKTGSTKKLASGDKVTILFNITNPKNAVIQELYT